MAIGEGNTFTTSCTFTELQPNAGLKEVLVTTPDAIASDIIQVTLEDHGISKGGLLSVNGFVKTASSTILIEKPTTSVTAGVLSITSGDSKGKKVYKIVGKSN